MSRSLDVKVLQKFKTSYNLAWSLDEIQRQYKMLADLAAAAGIIPGRVIFVSEEIMPVSMLDTPTSELACTEEAIAVSAVVLGIPLDPFCCQSTAIGLPQQAEPPSTYQTDEIAPLRLSIITAAAMSLGKGAELVLQTTKSREKRPGQHVVTIILAENGAPLTDSIRSCTVGEPGVHGKGNRDLDTVV